AWLKNERHEISPKRNTFLRQLTSICCSYAFAARNPQETGTTAAQAQPETAPRGTQSKTRFPKVSTKNRLVLTP
ncbi:hypothetical protein, partial [Salmonella sp. s58408]|uniref:hypothetical protein n=1 Tax=Salmonella sp. s58408 TaxID=3159701 RepID=UPI00397FC47B